MLSIHTHLKKSAMVGEAVLFVPVRVFHLVPPAGQQQLIRTVEGGGVHGVTVDQTDQVLSVMFPRQQYSILSVLLGLMVKFIFLVFLPFAEWT